MTKVCCNCKVEKPLSDFHFSKKNKNSPKVYPDSQCKVCKYAYTRKWIKDNTEKNNAYNTKSKLKNRYNITVDDYELMKSNQDGLCAICSKPPGRRKLAVDHCHQTNIVRGLLCDRCNLTLGMIKDDLNIIEGVKRYLLAHKK